MLLSPRASTRVIIIVAHPGTINVLRQRAAISSTPLRLLGPYPALKIGEPSNVMDFDLYPSAG